MSAFVVTNEHIDALITAGLHLDRRDPLRWYHKGYMQTLTYETASDVGLMLLKENHRSVDFRYKDGLPSGDVEVYEFRRLEGYPTPVVVLKAISCFEYQSCETDDWEASEAASFCRYLKNLAISKLPGYEDSPWCISDRRTFCHPIPAKRSA